MRRISWRRACHWRVVVTRVPSFITRTSGMAVRVGSSFTPGSVPSRVAIGGTGISRGGVCARPGAPVRAAATAARRRSCARMVRFTVAFGGAVAGRVAARCPRRTLEMSDDSTRTVSRRQFTSTAAMAALSAAIVPSRVLGAGRAQQQAESRRHRHRRHGRLEPQGLRRREHRRPVRRGQGLRRQDHRALPERQGLPRLHARCSRRRRASTA